MVESREYGNPKRRRPVITMIEVLVILLVITLLIALMLPAVESAREAARRVQCHNNLKQIASALANYSQTHKKLPAGTICNSQPTMPARQYDVWKEAGNQGPENHGTSLLLAVLPFIEKEDLYKKWASGQVKSGTTLGQWSPADNVGQKNAPGPAVANIALFYCPSRRNALRSQDDVMMLSDAWTGGGTDYGGCVGRQAAFTLKTGYNLCDASMQYLPGFHPVDPADNDKIKDNEKTRLGIFGRVNVGTTRKEIADGESCTLMIGELSKITSLCESTSSFSASSGIKFSKDGWSVGGPATLFTTGAMLTPSGTTYTFGSDEELGKSMNNGFFGSPGSEHANGANYGFADGSVRFLQTSIDPNIFALLGSMADGVDLEKIEY